SSVSHDLLGGFFKVQLSQKKKMLAARLTLAAVAVLGVLLARDPNSSVFRVVSFAWAGFGAAFGPVVLLALFWKRSNRQGALAGMIAGGVIVFAWKYGIAKLGGAFAIYELLPAFIVALIVNVAVSLLTKEPDENIVKTFEEVMGK
ncbi:MAG: sodium:proline symporter, partial [Lachnospiraceae bacterium]|nr:sodium:proline symporter [Lachnospiraceae bacterium]